MDSNEYVKKSDVLDILRTMPTDLQYEYVAELDGIWIDEEEVEGKWIDKGWHGDWQFETDGRGNCWKAFECSNCNTISKVQTNFCPNCGARMIAKDTNVPNKEGADDE